MSRRTHRPNDEQQIDLTPMLDVVFIMLIFFIVTATFIKLPGTDVVRPAGDSAVSLKPTMLVAVDSDSAIWINRERVDPRFIRTQLAALYAENPAGALVILADERAKVEQIAMIADAAKDIGIALVQIAADKG